MIECIHTLKLKANLPTPQSDCEWLCIERTSIDVRRSHIIADTLRELRKPRFDIYKMLKVLVIILL